MAIDVGTLVRVTTRVAAGGVMRLPFGRGLLVTLDDALSAGGAGKARLYENIGALNDDFDAGDALDAAGVWFSADPIPQGLWVGRWAPTDISTTLTGGTPSAATAFTGTDYSFAINGTNVTPIDLSTPTTNAAIATAIETVLAGTTGFAGATVTFASGAFIITLADGSAISPAYLTAAVDAMGTQVGTDLVPLLAMGEGDAIYRRGHDAESAVDAVGEMLALARAGSPVALFLAGDAPLTDPVSGNDTREDLAAFAQANNMVFGLLDTSDQAVTPNDATSQMALAFSRSQDKVTAVYSDAGEYPEIGLLAEMSAQNLNLPQSIITPHPKGIPGVAATDIDATQLAELARKRGNVLTLVGGLPSLLGGYTSRAGYWLDAVWWLLWMRNELQLSIWNAQRASRRFNAAILNDTLFQVARKGVRSGGIQPGRSVNAATRAEIIAATGNNDFDGVLSAGFLVWVDTSPSDLDVENRERGWKMWAVGSEAIHETYGDLTFVN